MKRAIIVASIVVAAGLLVLVGFLVSRSPSANRQQGAGGRGLEVPSGMVGPTVFPGPSGSVRVNIVRSVGGAFAGGIAKLPNGHYLVVYQSALHPEAAPPGGDNHAFELELGSDLMKPPTGDPVDMTVKQPKNLVPERNVYDPGVAVTKDRAVLITWYGFGIQMAKRLGPGRYTPAVTIAGLGRGEAMGFLEVTIQTLYGHTLVAYVGPPDTKGDRDVYVQEVHSDLTFGPRVKAGGPVGEGSTGLELRGNIAGVGDGRIMLVWGQRTPDSGPRSIYGSISSDLGRTWGPPIKIASLASQNVDMYNPFIVNSADSLTVYSQTCVNGGGCRLAMSVSTDHGEHWQPPSVPPLPAFARFVGRPVFIEVGGQVYCYTDIARPGDTRRSPQVAGRVLVIFGMPR